MSVIALATIKEDLRLTHDADDALLQRLVDAAEDEAMRFLDRTQLPTLPLDYPPRYDSDSNLMSEDAPSSEDPVAPSVYAAVFLLVRAKFDAATPAEIDGLRRAAETLLMPYRVGLGA